MDFSLEILPLKFDNLYFLSSKENSFNYKNKLQVNVQQKIRSLEKILEDRELLDPYIKAIISEIRLAVFDKYFNIIWVNEQFCRLSKYYEHELIGLPIQSLNLGYNNPDLFTTISKGIKWSGEIKSTAKDGSVFWVKANILPIRNKSTGIESYLLLCSNITATKVALDEKNLGLENLMKSEARYRALVENQSDLISLCKADGTLIYVNANYCNFFGKNATELLGTKVQDLFFNKISPAINHLISKLRLKNPPLTDVFELVDSSGEKYWISLCLKGIFDSNDQLFEVLITGRDVTELKMAELRKSRYVEDFERLAFISSHKVRGPIATLQGLLELLRMGAIHSNEREMLLYNFNKCLVDLDICTRELIAFIYIRQSAK